MKKWKFQNDSLTFFASPSIKAMQTSHLSNEKMSDQADAWRDCHAKGEPRFPLTSFAANGTSSYWWYS